MPRRFSLDGKQGSKVSKADGTSVSVSGLVITPAKNASEGLLHLSDDSSSHVSFSDSTHSNPNTPELPKPQRLPLGRSSSSNFFAIPPPRPKTLSSKDQITSPVVVSPVALPFAQKSVSSLFTKYLSPRLPPSTIPDRLMNCESIIRDYPLGYRGFLETYPATKPEEEMTRKLWGVDRFADPDILGMFARELFALYLDFRPVVSKWGIGTIVTIRKSIPVKKLREALLEYDRTMSFLLADYPIAKNIYQTEMKEIFFSEIPRNFSEIFSAIEKIHPFSDVLTGDQLTRANFAYERLRAAFKQNDIDSKKDQYSKAKESIDGKNEMLRDEISTLEKDKKMQLAKIKDNVDDYNKTEKNYSDKIAGINKRIRTNNRTLKKKEKKQEKEDLDLISEFRLNPIDHDFFERLDSLHKEECVKIKAYKKNDIKRPSLRDETINRDTLIEVCNYFLAKLRSIHPPFYDIGPEENRKDCYLNTKYKREFLAIQNGEEFKQWMQEKDWDYRQKLLEIVLFKALDYISSEQDIKLNKKEILFYTLKRMKGDIGVFNYDTDPEEFFNRAMGYTFEQIPVNIKQTSSTSSPRFGCS